MGIIVDRSQGFQQEVSPRRLFSLKGGRERVRRRGREVVGGGVVWGGVG